MECIGTNIATKNAVRKSNNNSCDRSGGYLRWGVARQPVRVWGKFRTYLTAYQTSRTLQQW